MFEMICADLCLDLAAKSVRTFTLSENDSFLIAALSSTRLFGYNLLVELILALVHRNLSLVFRSNRNADSLVNPAVYEEPSLAL